MAERACNSKSITKRDAVVDGEDSGQRRKGVGVLDPFSLFNRGRTAQIFTAR